MKKMYLMLSIIMIAFTSLVFAQADMKDDIAMIKKNLADSKVSIKQYAWIETTTTFIDGEQKSVKQNQCYYSVDGKLTKVETGGSTPNNTPGGLKGKIAANKKADMAEYVKKAQAKIATYLPPDANKIQQIYAAGGASIQILQPGKKFKLGFPDYNEKGDLLSISLDKENQKFMGAAVNTYIDDPADKVMFNITYSSLPDGTQYPANTTLEVTAKKLKIVIEDSGFKKSAQ